MRCLRRWWSRKGACLLELERRALVEVRLPHAHACLGRLRQGVPSGAAPLADAPRMAPRLYAGWRRLRGDYGPQFRGMGRSLKGSAGRASPRQAPEGFAELYLFPGVEISVSGAVHVPGIVRLAHDYREDCRTARGSGFNRNFWTKR